MCKNVFLESQVADNYDNYYETEIGKRINKIETQLVLNALKSFPKEKMLELGCGTGHWTELFVQQGFDVVATDISDAMLKYARQKKLKAEVLKADSNNLPFEDNSFTIIASITMLEFVDDPDTVFNEIFRVLKPGGYLLLGCLNENSELGKTKHKDPVFKSASFFSPKNLAEKLKMFGNAKIEGGVYFSSTFEIMDEHPDHKTYEPAFLLAVVQKK